MIRNYGIILLHASDNQRDNWHAIRKLNASSTSGKKFYF
jgi:hypothetical protein